ncbi:MAG: hypothetical protein ABW003_16530 [Microvirga sp.]
MSDPIATSSISTRADALALLERVKAGMPESEIGPYVRDLMTHDFEQTFAVMRGSGNEMSLSLQLLTLLANKELITEDEVYAAEDARIIAGKRAAA